MKAYRKCSIAFLSVVHAQLWREEKHCLRLKLRTADHYLSPQVLKNWTAPPTPGLGLGCSLIQLSEYQVGCCPTRQSTTIILSGNQPLSHLGQGFVLGFITRSPPLDLATNLSGTCMSFIILVFTYLWMYWLLLMFLQGHCIPFHQS